jgi:hypothetical protein
LENLNLSPEEEKLLSSVLILSIYKKHANSTLEEVLNELDEVGSIKHHESKLLLEKLQKENLLTSSNELTFLGITKAKEAENEFKIIR